MTARSSPAFTREALDEPRNETRFTHHLDVLALAALELLLAHAAGEIDGEPVAVARRPVRFHLVAGRPLGQARHALVDRLLGDLGHRALELELGEIRERDLGQGLVGHREGEIALARKHALELFLVLAEVDVGLVRCALLALLDGLAARLLDGLLQHLCHHRAAVELLEVRHGHFALAEALELHLFLELVEPRCEALRELALVDDDLQLALETGDRRFADLHDFCLTPRIQARPTQPRSGGTNLS